MCNKLKVISKVLYGKENYDFNPIHVVLFILITFPIILFYKTIYPIATAVVAVIIGINFLIFFLRLFCKDSYKIDVKRVRDSIPKFNLFHIIMFVIIGFPFLFLFGSIIVAFFE